MKVWFVGAGPGDPELLTVRAKRLLEMAELAVYAGSLIPTEITSLLPPTCERHDSSAMSLKEVLAVYQKAEETGRDVVRLHSGDTSLYSTINEQIPWLESRGIGYEVVPGISAFSAAAAALGKQLTLSGGSQTVILTRAAGKTPVPDAENLASLAAHGATICLFLSTGILRDAAALLEGEYGSACPAYLVAEASRPGQRILKERLGRIADAAEAAGISRTALLIVGQALDGEVKPTYLYSGRYVE